MKQKITNILFKVSFISYFIPILLGIYSSIFGFEWFFSTSYGWDAFLNATYLSAIILCVIPIIPICFLYEIIYMICKKYKKRKSQ